MRSREIVYDVTFLHQARAELIVIITLSGFNIPSAPLMPFYVTSQYTERDELHVSLCKGIKVSLQGRRTF